MTYEEILKHTRNYISDILKVQPMSELTMHIKCQQLDVVETIADALERQIPKKPSGSFDDEVYGKTYVCKCTGVIDKYQKYCPSCGQALDWSE